MQVEVPVFTNDVPDNLRVEVCVVGGGIAGLSTAYHVARAGLDVVVIDDGPIGGGETGRTSAHLASALDDRFHRLEKVHGAEGARLAAASHAAAIDDIEQITRRHGIACELQRVDGYLFVPPGSSTEELARELAAAHRAGLIDAEMVPRAPIPGFDTGACVRFPNQAEFHPLAYLRGLAGALERLGGRIYSGVRAEHVESGTPNRIHTDAAKTILAKTVVIATNAPITSKMAIPLRQAAYRTYAIALRIPSGAVPHALYWDTQDPYHYVRVAAAGDAVGGELLIVGGEDHKTGQDNAGVGRWRRLERWARERFTTAGEVTARWSGQIMEPADGVGFIGRSPDADEILIATGDSGHGLTHGAIAGLLLTDLVLGRDNPWARLYDPRRTSLRAIGKIMRENVNVAAQYADWLGAGDVASVDQIPPGAGAVVRRGLRMVAVYRDPAGAYHQRSATCTHLGGVVAWNPAEQSWDCPCHGSRFDPLGRVITGPAASDLAVVGDEE